MLFSVKPAVCLTLCVFEQQRVMVDNSGAGSNSLKAGPV